MQKVTQAEFARLVGVNRSTVHKWVKAGRVALDADGLLDAQAAQRMRDETESLQPHHQAKKMAIELEKQAAGRVLGPDWAQVLGGAQKGQQGPDFGLGGGNAGNSSGNAGGNSAAAGTVGGAMGDLFDSDGESATVNARYKLAMAKEREAKAELAAMEVDKAAGLLLDRTEVDFVLADVGSTLRTKLEALPDLLVERLAPLRGDLEGMRRTLEQELRDVLADVSAVMKRRMAEVAP